MRKLLILTILGLFFASVTKAQDIWFDVDATITSCPVNLNPVQTSDGTVDAGVTFEDAGITVEWNFVTPAGAITHTAVTPATGAGDYYWQILGEGIYAITIPASGGATINNDTEGFGWFSCDTTATLPWRGPVIGFRSANKNDLEIEDGTAGTNQDNFFDGTGLSVATFTTDGMTQANIETYSQTGAAAAITADAEIEKIKDDVADILVDTGTTIPATLTGVVILETTIAAVTTPDTVFTLTAGGVIDDIYNGMTIVIQDDGAATTETSVTILDYAQATKTITLSTDPTPGAWTLDAGDKVWILADHSASVSSSEIADAIRTEPVTNSETVNTIGWLLNLIKDLLY